VFLVDDNDDFLDGISAWMKHDRRLDIVGRAHSGQEAIEAVTRLVPDLVLVSTSLDGMNGFETTRRIKSSPDAPLVVMLAFHDSETAQLEAWAAGADGFVSKAETTERLMPVVRDLLQQQAERGEDKKVADSAKSTRNEPAAPTRDINDSVGDSID